MPPTNVADKYNAPGTGGGGPVKVGQSLGDDPGLNAALAKALEYQGDFDGLGAFQQHVAATQGGQARADAAAEQYWDANPGTRNLDAGMMPEVIWEKDKYGNASRHISQKQGSQFLANVLAKSNIGTDPEAMDRGSLNFNLSPEEWSVLEMMYPAGGSGRNDGSAVTNNPQALLRAIQRDTSLDRDTMVDALERYGAPSFGRRGRDGTPGADSPAHNPGTLQGMMDGGTGGAMFGLGGAAHLGYMVGDRIANYGWSEPPWGGGMETWGGGPQDGAGNNTKNRGGSLFGGAGEM
jgi:hypothetical protein